MLIRLLDLALQDVWWNLPLTKTQWVGVWLWMAGGACNGLRHRCGVKAFLLTDAPG